MKVFWFLLFPFAFLYGFFMRLRRWFFNSIFMKRTSFDFPTIGVGNLSVGGTGKSPQVEYLARLLKDDYNVAILSRGYGRKTRGYVLADDEQTASTIGDEPMMFYSRFKDELKVVVSESRRKGVKRLKEDFPDINLILFDDVYQHLSVKCGLNILLTDYYSPYFRNYLMPVGSLRESSKVAKHADIIVVTKCPKVLSPLEIADFVSKINLLDNQSLYFTYYEYEDLVPVNNLAQNYDLSNIGKILMFTGIANPYPMKKHLEQFASELIELSFMDHHNYSRKDLLQIKKTFDDLLGINKIVITTEKDYMRLKCMDCGDLINSIPLFYLPINVSFHQNKKDVFNQQIIDYVRKNSRNS